jgi:hypothetical protein
VQTPTGAQANASFDAADTDKDGVVSRSEASAISGLDFSSADADNNSTLDRQEFTLAMAGSGRPRG